MTAILRISSALVRQRASIAPLSRVRFFSSSDDGKPLHKTALHDAHVQLGAKMVPFAGYSMPVQYKESLLVSHAWVRESAGLFDVSHMGQLILRGKDRLKFLESLTPSDLLGLKPNQAKLSVLTNENGGILDDCLITNKSDHVYMVVNAGCKDSDIAHLKKHLALYNKKHSADVTMQYIQNRSLLALQGPKAASVLSRFVKSDLNKLGFMFTEDMKVNSIDCWVNRCGYTGEDGFEISVPDAKATALMDTLLKQPEVQAAGLGVRDSLRLEAGLCLYGHDLNDTITPVEASLTWLIGKRRREQGGFPGHATIVKQIKEGTKRKRVGLAVLEGAPAREGAEIVNPNGGAAIGIVTSGTHSPTLKSKISMGYIDSAFASVGTKVAVKVRGKVGAAEVTKMPFVPNNYFKSQ